MEVLIRCTYHEQALGFLMYRIIPSVNKVILISFFPIYIHFISISCLIVLRVQTQHRVEKETMDILVLFLILVEALSVSTLGMMLAEGVLIFPLLCWALSLHPQLSRTFISKVFLDISKALSASNEMIMWCMFLTLFLWISLLRQAFPRNLPAMLASEGGRWLSDLHSPSSPPSPVPQTTRSKK